MEISTLPFKNNDLEEREAARFLIFVIREDQRELVLDGVMGRVKPKMPREDDMGGEFGGVGNGDEGETRKREDFWILINPPVACL